MLACHLWKKELNLQKDFFGNVFRKCFPPSNLITPFFLQSHSFLPTSALGHAQREKCPRLKEGEM